MATKKVMDIGKPNPGAGLIQMNMSGYFSRGGLNPD